MHCFKSNLFVASSRRVLYKLPHSHVSQQLFLRHAAASSIASRTTAGLAEKRSGDDGVEQRKSLRLYRILLRQCQRLFSEREEWLLQPSLNPRDYGQARHFSMDPADIQETEKDHLDKKVFDVLNLFRIWSNLRQETRHPERWSWFVSVMKGSAYFEETQKAASGDDDDIMDWEEQFLNEPVESHLPSLWISHVELKNAIRRAFQTGGATTSGPSHVENHNVSPVHGLAIHAVKLLVGQESMIERTSVSVHKGCRVVATSRCIGRASSGGNGGGFGSEGQTPEIKYRFAYRIRVENLPSNDQTVQLLGRTWNIHETNDQGDVAGEPVKVVAPNTGAVGHIPVLKPGDVFAYMSGCELSTETGTMDGCFHMAVVPQDAESAVVGDAVEAIASSDKTNKFKMPVEPFLLIAK